MHVTKALTQRDATEDALAVIWLHQVERFFALPTEPQISRGVGNWKMRSTPL